MKLPVEKYYRLIAPRPAVLVTTIDEEGNPNAAPISYIAPISSSPSLLVFSTHQGGDTYRNISDTEEFVVNITTEEMVRKVYACEKSLPRTENELERAGLDSEESVEVEPPRVSKSPASIECKLEWTKDEPEYVSIARRIVRVEADENALKDEKMNVEEVKPLLHLSGRSFVIGDHRIEI